MVNANALNIIIFVKKKRNEKLNKQGQQSFFLFIFFILHLKLLLAKMSYLEQTINLQI